MQLRLLPLDTKISHYLASQLHFSIQNSGELEQIFVQQVKLLSEIGQFLSNPLKWGPHTVPRGLGIEANPGDPIPGVGECKP